MLARSLNTSVTFRDVFALTKPRLSLLVIVTCGGGMFLAPGVIDPVRAFFAILSTTMIVGAANALNSYMERDLDRYMERTRKRPLPDQRLDPRVALVTAAVLAALSMPTLLFGINAVTGALAALAIVSYVAVYTPLKQKSPLAMWVGAIPGAIPTLMGWTAVRGRIELPGLVLFGVLFFWQLPHFIAIAMYRREDYGRAGHKVLPLVVSDFACKLHIVGWTLALIPCTLALTLLGVAGWYYFGVAALLGAGFLGQSLAGFRRGVDDRVWAKKLFFSSLGYLTVLFAALMLDARS